MNYAKIILRSGCFCALLIAAEGASAQVSNDTLVYQAALDNAKNKVVKSQQPINIGSEYVESYYYLRNGHPYFKSHLSFSGDIIYNGIAYRDQQLQYELIRDEVIAEHIAGQRIVLVKAKIQSFSLEKDFFIRLDDPLQKLDGFYHVLADQGDVKLLAKRTKKFTGKMYEEMPFVEQKNKYFVMKDGTAHPVRSYKNIISILYGKEKGVRLTKKFDDRESEMIDIVKQYTLK